MGSIDDGLGTLAEADKERRRQDELRRNMTADRVAQERRGQEVCTCRSRPPYDPKTGTWPSHWPGCPQRW